MQPSTTTAATATVDSRLPPPPKPQPPQQPLAALAAPSTPSMPPPSQTPAVLPPGWHACTDPKTGRPYWFDTNTQTSHWTPPTAASFAGAGAHTRGSGSLPLGPHADASSRHRRRARHCAAGAPPSSRRLRHSRPPSRLRLHRRLLRRPRRRRSPSSRLRGAQWALCPPDGINASTRRITRPYYFNTVTQQSQWTFPKAAAAVPMAMLPRPESPKSNSPTAVRRVGNELGGVGDIAAQMGLKTPESAVKQSPLVNTKPLAKEGLGRFAVVGAIDRVRWWRARVVEQR